MKLDALLAQILWLFAAGFFVANLRVAIELTRWWQRRRTALLVWPSAKPPFYAMSLGIGVMLGLLILLKAYLALRGVNTLGAWARAFVTNTIGELMMFVYFGYMLPLSQRITRGLYRDGIWTDTGFLTYPQIVGIAWREGPSPTLLIISRVRAMARRLEVPTTALGEVRRILRDQISSHAIEIDDGPGLHLGSRDARDSV